MASGKGGPVNLASYVREREVGRAVDSYEDLKVPVPNTEGSRAVHSVRKYPSAVQQRIHDNQVPVKQEPNARKPFYGTDTGSSNDTSETPSLLKIQPTQHQDTRDDFVRAADHDVHLSYDAQHAEDQFEPDGEDCEDDERGSEDEQEEDEAPDGLDREQYRLMRSTDSELAKRKQGAAFGYMRGDSYPSTTSGPPSVVPVAQTRQENGASPMLESPHDQMQKQRAKQQHWPVQQNGTSQGRSGYQQPEPNDIMKPRHSTSVNENQVVGQRARVLRSAPGPTQRPTAKLALHTHRQTEPAAKTSNPTDRKPFIPHDYRLSTQATAAEREAGQAWTPAGDRVQQNASLSRVPQAPEAHNPAGLQRRIPQAPDEANINKRVSRISPDPETTPDELDQDTPQYELDYETDELYSKDFSDLKSQPFDSDPRFPDTFPDRAKNDPIEDQLRTAFDFSERDQHKFLTSLSIDEWELAGDWFLGKFGETLTTMKKLRQAKRTAARAFEEEVEARHVAVAIKRNLTEAALGEMKANGRTVLEGTPRAKRVR